MSINTATVRKTIDDVLSVSGFHRRNRIWEKASEEVRWVIRIDVPSAVGRLPRLDVEFGISMNAADLEIRPNFLPIYGSITLIGALSNSHIFSNALMLDQPFADAERMQAITLGMKDLVSFVASHQSREAVIDAYRKGVFSKIFVSKRTKEQFE